MLGYYDAGFTLRTYTHATRQKQDEAAATMGSFMAQVMYDRKKAGREAQTSRPALFSPFPVWVTVWVNQLTHILTYTKKSKIATKKPRKPKFSRLFGAARQIRTADLILTKDALYRLSYSSK